MTTLQACAAAIFNSVSDAETLTDAAMRACDCWHDSPAQRELMRREIAATPEHLRADLLDHLEQTYRAMP